METYGFKKLELVQNNGEATAPKATARAPTNGDVASLDRAQDAQIFPTLDSLLEFVTKRWLRHCVLANIRDEAVLDALSKRPFFLLVSVDAPLLTRWQRCQRRNSVQGREGPSLEQFVAWNDELVGQKSSELAKLMHRAELRLVNGSQSIEILHRGLEALKLAEEERLRPSWDQYFMRLASLAAQRSNCMKRRVGCVLVREKRVISTGYNGTPRHLKNCNQGGCKLPDPDNYGRTFADRKIEARGAMAAIRAASRSPHASAYTLKRTLFSKRAVSAFGRAPFCTAIRRSMIDGSG